MSRLTHKAKSAVQAQLLISLLIPLLMLLAFSSCGKKKDLETGDELDPATLGGGGANREEGTAFDLGDIVEVTMIAEGVSGITGWTAADLPFTGPSAAIGQAITNGQTPFSYSFTYPENNFQLSNAHLVIDTSRDNSDTEAMFVDGVYSGRPPADQVNLASTKITDFVFTGTGGTGENTYYIDWSLSHYKQNTRNTFDLTLDDLLTPTETSSYDALSDGYLPVVAGDDSPIYQAILVINGLTIADEDLECSDSESFSFQNVYLHNDGNSVGEAAFDGSVSTPFASWGSAVGTFPAVEFYYDAAIPKVQTENITIATASLSLSVKRAAAGQAAIVINGIGVAESGFDKDLASDVVESWDDSADAVGALNSFLTSIPTNGNETAGSIDLVAMFGATGVRNLLAQGKFNVAVAGSITTVKASAATTARGFQVAVTGPELTLTGSYFTEVCEVTDNPDSPLKQSGLEQRDYDDGVGPEIFSVQATDISATSASIIWLTDEPATSQVAYGVKNTNSLSDLNEEYALFHQIDLTGLQPYKYYYFQVMSADNFGNESATDVVVFLTLR